MVTVVGPPAVKKTTALNFGVSGRDRLERNTPLFNRNRPPNSAAPMSEAGQTEPELWFSLNTWLGRRDDPARP